MPFRSQNEGLMTRMRSIVIPRIDGFQFHSPIAKLLAIQSPL